MRLNIIAGALVLMALFVATGAAQQDPLDLGAADTAYFVISEPVVGAVDQVVTAELYFFHDAQDMGSFSGGYSWDNPNFVMESASFTDEATASFDMMRLVYYQNTLAATNENQLFQSTGLRIFGPGQLAAPVAQLIATYTFRVSSWSASDQFCISLADFTGLAFVDFNNDEYPPIWEGPLCVGNVPTGFLEVDPGTLGFSGEAGGANPSPLSTTVTNAMGDPIFYEASTESSWVNLVSIDGTTPSPLWIGANIAGLAAGDYMDSVHVTSAAATNDVWVYVNLHLDEPNQAPVLDPIGDQGGPENSLIEFTISASDPDGGFPGLDVYNEPASATFTDNGNGTGTFSWMTTYDDAGEYLMTFIAGDEELDDQESITLRITNVNRNPSMDPVADQMVLEGVNLNFTVMASDPDMEILDMTADLLAANYTDNGDNTGTFDWTPGNTDAGFYDVTFTATDLEGAFAEVTMTIEVIDADGFLLDPNPLVFAAAFGGVDPDEQTFSLSISDGSMTAFSATTDATWFTLTSDGSYTPSSVTVFVHNTGLAAGFYRDSITIVGGGLDPVYEYVELTITNTMVVDPMEISWTVSAGDMIVPVEQYINVTEVGGDAIAYEATTEAAWLTFGMGTATGTTPGSILAGSIPANRPGPGVYNTTIVITSVAGNSPVTIPVSLTVTECPTLAMTEVVYEQMIIAGETAMIDEMVSLMSSGPGEIDWEAMGSMAYTFTPTTGTTPGDLGVHYEQMFDTEGMYSDTAYVSSVSTPTYSCPSEFMIITNVTVNRPPSADTIIVVSTPAVPGMRVGVPVIFTNSCRLTGLGLSLNWTADMHLDSVSFEGSAINYVDNKMVTINNDLMDLTITATVDAQMMVPIGSEQVLATLFFALPCEIEEGTYGFELGATPPLNPVDVYFERDCGGGVGTEFPEYIPGSVIVGTASNYVCGYVVDQFDNEIEGATVQLWEDYPFTTPLTETMSSSIGGFAFDEIMVIPFDLYAYKEGYYPGSVEDINFGDKGIKIVLEPLPGTLVPTSQWVDYYSPEGASIFLGVPVPVGAVIEAFTPAGLLVGRQMVTTSGQYGFMPVYRANPDLNDLGAIAGEMIRFTINGMDALTIGDAMFPDELTQTMEISLEVRGTLQNVCTLVDGWNLISWNVNTDTDDILTVLAPIMEYVDVVLGFEQGGLTFDPDLQAFSTLWNVDHYSGYWVRIEGAGDVELAITGLPVAETTPIALTAGWNLVSYLPEMAMPVEEALASVVDVVDFAYGFPMGNIGIWEPGGAFNQLSSFDPCNGYWIKTTADAWLTYNTVAPPAAAPRPAGQELALSARIAQNSWVNVYSKDLTLDEQIVTSGTTVNAHAVKNDDIVGTFTLNTDGQFGFMPVYASASGETVAGIQAGEEFYLTVNDTKTDEVFTWTNNGDRIEVAALSTASSIGEVLPENYSLAQNYPNPFNPSTNIAFNMPVTGQAKIEIFNVLGRSIAVIFEGQALAGQNNVVWDGRNSDGDATASGVYFYRLTADTYTETRKMMLLK